MTPATSTEHTTTNGHSAMQPSSTSTSNSNAERDTAAVPGSPLRFLLNNQEVTVDDISCQTTLLDYIRETAQLKGTKEGCAEGDCGACTVLLGRLLRGQLVYETINSCIRLLASVHACHVVTIEYLSAPVDTHADTELHPVQTAILNQHGSQCGFCTPGIVMSLYALWMEYPSPNENDIEKALQGNLCRCTGYEPLIKAAVEAAKSKHQSQDSLYLERKRVSSLLQQMQNRERIVFSCNTDVFVRPPTMADAVSAMTEYENATVLAGSTDIGLWVNKSFKRLSPVVSISHLDELHQIDHSKGGLTLGACVTYSEALPALITEIPQLEEYWHRIGGEQVRNMGTIGGNIANGSPIGDTPAPFIALGAVLHLQSSRGLRTVPIEDFFIEYGKQDRAADELLQAIHIPQQDQTSLFHAYKVSKRFDEDISTVCCGFRVTIEDDKVTKALLAYGGMAGVPARARIAESRLEGQLWNLRTVKMAMEAIEKDFTPMSDHRASAEYRQIVAANLLKRFYLEHPLPESESAPGQSSGAKSNIVTRINRSAESHNA